MAVTGEREIVNTRNAVPPTLRNWILGDHFSCLGARAALRQQVLHTVSVGALGERRTIHDVYLALAHFVASGVVQRNNFATMVAIFEETSGMGTETLFDRLLWTQLQGMHDLDSKTRAWAPDVDADPRSPHFAFSLVGHPLFVIGVHPAASRVTRRFHRPAIAFNSHRNLRHLKANGIYQGLQHRIRAREIRLQGSLNPNLADFGEMTEARQYSGIITGDGWRCPFSPKG